MTIHIGAVLAAAHAIKTYADGPDDIGMHECIDMVQEYLEMTDDEFAAFEAGLGIGIVVGRQDIISQMCKGTPH